MLALCRREFGEHRSQIELVLTLHLVGELGVSVRRFLFHRVGKREQFVQGLKDPAGSDFRSDVRNSGMIHLRGT